MNRKGMTLIELLVALSVSGILVAGVYKTFISQQHTFSVQEQVVDMQQSVRLAINQMTRELRMAGFGGGGADGWNSTEFFKHGAIYGSYTGVVNPIGGTNVTVLEGYEPLIRTTLSQPASASSPSPNNKTIFVNDVSGFDQPPNPKIYISVNGTEAHHIASIDTAAKSITFAGWDKLVGDHQIGEPVYVIAAVTYSIGMFDGKPNCLLRDDHLGSGPQPVADNIESLQFAYFDKNGNATGVPADIRMIQVTVVAVSDRPDKDLAKAGDGLRRRTVRTNLQLRNMLF